MKAPIVYNLFPRLCGSMDSWPEHAQRAKSMGFNWIYLNPVSLPGFSRSLYSVKEYFRICPDFLPAGSSDNGIDELRRTLAAFRDLGLRSAMDLVINHTAIDCPLTESHPEWYVHDADGKIVNPSAIDPADARKVTVLGDLAEIDNAASPDRKALWDYWRELVCFYIDLGFEGFRCDAAYKVPADLWKVLTDSAHEKNSQVTFFAETLGCRIEEVRSLSGAGLDYLFNSSKYWNFDAAWALEQHESFGALAPSLSFAESHDTERLFAETDGNLAAVRQRYLFSALFSKGLMMPVGYEFGFTKPLNVVSMTVDDWEQTDVDLTAFIRAVNRLKLDLAVLGEEGHWRALGTYDRPILALEKSNGPERILVLVNKDWRTVQRIDLDELGSEIPRDAKLVRIDHLGGSTTGAIP
ncbi:MAG: hypothetical protein JRJ19_10725, partial [Deltaproteobacteria bacterium]|nr:hypothetical protein [Deltaproteobacteria bacterium]